MCRLSLLLTNCSPNTGMHPSAVARPAAETENPAQGRVLGFCARHVGSGFCLAPRPYRGDFLFPGRTAIGGGVGQSFPFGRAYSVEQSAEPSSPAAVLRAGGAYGPGHTLRTPRKHFRASRPPASALGPTVMVVATFWSSEIMRGLAGLFALVGSLSSLFSTGRR